MSGDAITRSFAAVRALGYAAGFVLLCWWLPLRRPSARVLLNVALLLAATYLVLSLVMGGLQFAR